jgi:hypothetical protein
MKAKKNGDGDRGLDPVWLTGCDAIASAVGIDRRDIPVLVRTENLPAFKWRGRWRALPEDLSRWSKSMAKKYRRNRAGPKTPAGRPSKTIV